MIKTKKWNWTWKAFTNLGVPTLFYPIIVYSSQCLHRFPFVSVFDRSPPAHFRLLVSWTRASIPVGSFCRNTAPLGSIVKSPLVCIYIRKPRIMNIHREPLPQINLFLRIQSPFTSSYFRSLLLSVENMIDAPCCSEASSTSSRW